MTLPPYYTISDLAHDNVRVRFILPYGPGAGGIGPEAEVTGFRVRYRKRVPITWTAPRTDAYWTDIAQAPMETRQARSSVIYRVEREEYVYVKGKGAVRRITDLPPSANPVLWRPIDAAEWMRKHGPLPAAAPITLSGEPSWQQPAPASEPDRADWLDWPEHYHEAGSISRREAEVRAIRGWRTLQCVRTPADAGGTGAGRLGWMGVKSSAAMVLDRSLALRDPNDHPAEPTPVRWEPDRRDLADWEAATGWLRGLEAAERKAVMMRSAFPPYPWRTIAQRLGYKEESGARKCYARAIDKVCEAANRIEGRRAA